MQVGLVGCHQQHWALQLKGRASRGTVRESIAKVQSNEAEYWAGSFMPAQSHFPFR